MFIRKTKKTNSAYVIAIVLSLLAFFIFGITQRTRITEYRLKYNGDVAYEQVLDHRRKKLDSPKKGRPIIVGALVRIV